jgi:hypothetical protein
MNSQFVDVGLDTLNPGSIRVNGARPRQLPVDSAPVLASVVTAPITARASQRGHHSAGITARDVQDHHVVCGKTPYRVTVDTGFVDPALNAKQCSAPIQHFRHK